MASIDRSEAIIISPQKRRVREQKREKWIKQGKAFKGTHNMIRSKNGKEMVRSKRIFQKIEINKK